MKYVSKTIVILEMDEHETEVVLSSVAFVAEGTLPGKKSQRTARNQAEIFMTDYQKAIKVFYSENEKKHSELR